MDWSQISDTKIELGLKSQSKKNPKKVSEVLYNVNVPVDQQANSIFKVIFRGNIKLLGRPADVYLMLRVNESAYSYSSWNTYLEDFCDYPKSFNDKQDHGFSLGRTAEHQDSEVFAELDISRGINEDFVLAKGESQWFCEKAVYKNYRYALSGSWQGKSAKIETISIVANHDIYAEGELKIFSLK